MITDISGRSGRAFLAAIVAVAASMLRAIYHILRDGVPYRSLGSNHFDGLSQQRAKRRLVQRLNQLGYQVELGEAAA